MNRRIPAMIWLSMWHLQVNICCIWAGCSLANRTAFEQNMLDISILPVLHTLDWRWQVGKVNTLISLCVNFILKSITGNVRKSIQLHRHELMLCACWCLGRKGLKRVNLTLGNPLLGHINPPPTQTERRPLFGLRSLMQSAPLSLKQRNGR